MKELINTIRTAYALHNVTAEVDSNGSELIVNILEPELVEHYSIVDSVIRNKQAYSNEDLLIAENFVSMTRAAGIEALQDQTQEEKQLYINSGVTRYSYRIGGKTVYTIDYPPSK